MTVPDRRCGSSSARAGRRRPWRRCRQDGTIGDSSVKDPSSIDPYTSSVEICPRSGRRRARAPPPAAPRAAHVGLHERLGPLIERSTWVSAAKFTMASTPSPIASATFGVLDRAGARGAGRRVLRLSGVRRRSACRARTTWSPWSLTRGGRIGADEPGPPQTSSFTMSLLSQEPATPSRQAGRRGLARSVASTLHPGAEPGGGTRRPWSR